LQHLPITGANDGASGVAVLMELGNLIAERGPNVNVDLLLVDGEDWGMAGDIDHYLLGSRHFARTGVRGRYHFGFVVDLVGDRDQQIYREEYSQRFIPWLNDLVWQTAAELAIPTFHDSTKWRVHDDHMALNVGGIPTIVVVDFDYPYWHTEHDTDDKCSPEALENVGRVITKIVYTPSTWPTRK
jgi:Zn-dependent M28 family amino/carboxypeptidase